MMICSDGLADCFENHDELASKIPVQIVLDNSANGFDSVEADITGSMPELIAPIHRRRYVDSPVD